MPLAKGDITRKTTWLRTHWFEVFSCFTEDFPKRYSGKEIKIFGILGGVFLLILIAVKITIMRYLMVFKSQLFCSGGSE